MERLLHRFNRTLGRAAKRVLFLPAQTDVRFHRLLSLADVVLDPPHYSAGFTAYDAFALGIPLVTLPGELHISRYSLGCYRKMKLEELVPTTAQEYVNLAIQIAQEHDFQRYLRKKILERCDVLYSDNLAVTAMENWLDTVITNNSTQK
jgi:predicted O-linked N-acetylglucosamine transferase (SPINDLY family)